MPRVVWPMKPTSQPVAFAISAAVSRPVSPSDSVLGMWATTRVSAGVRVWRRVAATRAAMAGSAGPAESMTICSMAIRGRGPLS